MYKSIYKKGQDQFDEKKSIFIGYSAPVETEEEALEFIDEIKKKHFDATHNCTAYIIGEDKMIQRFSDDGEPSGTAGIPMLEVLKREDLTNLAVVVTRYFGGSLLGSGGLIRAYSKGAKIAVDSGLIVEMVEYTVISITYDYIYHGKITNYLETRNFIIDNTIYEENVKNFIKVRYDRIDEIKEGITEITSANAIFEEVENILVAEKDGEVLNG